MAHDNDRSGKLTIHRTKPAYLWKTVMWEDDGTEIAFVISTRGHVIQHGLPIWAWLIITGVASSALSLLLVWVIWG